MNTTEQPVGIPAQLKADLLEAIQDLAKGVRNPVSAKRASQRMDRMREENRTLFGEQNCAVELIRDTRDRS